MSAIQFIGKEAVLDAFNDLSGNAWGLYDGQKPILYGEGADSLDTWLERFLPGGSTAQYTLRVYDVSLPVKTTTDYVAAFKFRLSDPYGGAGIGGNTSKLLDRIGELEKKVKDGDGEGGEDIMDHIIGWFKDPEKLESVVGTIKQLLGSQTPQALPAAENIQAMAGFKVTSDNANDNDAKLNRLAAVLDDLEKRDPKLLDHLEKLSKLDAMTFGMVTSRLDSL